MTDFKQLILALASGNVEFILVGGVAARAHGSARYTEDLDIVYRRSPDNIERIVDALARYAPYLRGAPPGLPFRLDARTIERGLNFTLTTSLGGIDLLGEITGGGSYDELKQHSEPVEIFGVTLQCIALGKLIHVKRAAGRPKDFEAIAELEALREEQQGRS